MIRYNSDNIVVGEIKQLLHSFNLPQATVLTGNETTFTPNRPNRIYIKDHTVYKSVKKEKESSASSTVYGLKKLDDVSYDWGDKLLNITHTLDITSNIYDSYTHKYLGNYLRFLRDYRGIDLMSMYNCFSNEIPSNVSISVPKKVSDEITVTYTFDSSDSTHKLYMIPIKAGKVYTIALNTSRPIEMIAGIYAHNELLSYLQGTFKIKNGCSSSEVFLYEGVKDVTLSETYQDKEDCLYLFLNLHADYNSSIVILEGDYTKNNNVFLNSNGYTEIMYKPSAYDNLKTSLKTQKTPSRLQLLSCRGTYSYPFADKLLQYLFSHVITPIDDIYRNIKKAQSKLYKEGYLNAISDYGNWTDEDTAACFLCSHKNVGHREINKDYDVIGYLDSDIEVELGGLD